jgi:transposase
MQALHGGKATSETIDAQKLAVLRRGGMLPQADVYPATMRAPRDLLRRRTPLRRTRAEWLAHIPNTHSQDHLPESGKKLATKANRHGVAARFPAPAVHKSIEVDLALIGPYDHRLRDVARSILNTATRHHAQPLYRRRTVPGIGELLSLVLLYAIHDSARFPRGQASLSYGRLVKGTKGSAGKRYGTSGTKLGNVHLTGACSEAAVLLLRDNPVGQKHLPTREQQHGSGTALTLLAQTLGRAVYDRWKRPTAFAMGQFLPGYGSGADEPNAELDTHGLSLRVVLGNACVAASVNASEHRGPVALIL